LLRFLGEIILEITNAGAIAAMPKANMSTTVL